MCMFRDESIKITTHLQRPSPFRFQAGGPKGYRFHLIVLSMSWAIHEVIQLVAIVSD
jgi:hypothetical protein